MAKKRIFPKTYLKVSNYEIIGLAKKEKLVPVCKNEADIILSMLFGKKISGFYQNIDRKLKEYWLTSKQIYDGSHQFRENISKYLIQMIKKGLIKIKEIKPRGKRNEPKYLYSLSIGEPTINTVLSVVHGYISQLPKEETKDNKEPKKEKERWIVDFTNTVYYKRIAQKLEDISKDFLSGLWYEIGHPSEGEGHFKCKVDLTRQKIVEGHTLRIDYPSLFQDNSYRFHEEFAKSLKHNVINPQEFISDVPFIDENAVDLWIKQT